ncbi:MAG: hypothetical protein ABIT71_17745 [Vicinamibacteraceae bacterium]
MRLLVRLLAVLLAAAVVSGGAPGDIGLAVVRGDGRLQPLARLDGETWSPLPAAAAAGDWGLWLLDDPVLKTSPFAIRAARPITVAANAANAVSACLPVSGLDASLTSAPPAPASGVPQASPLLGVALFGTDIRPDLPIPIAVDSELGRQLATRAAAAFHRAEDETLTLEAEELPAGFPTFAARRERPITWTVVARQGLSQAAAKTYYVEGRKDYEGFRGRTDIGRIRTTGHVFLRMAADRETIDAEVDLSDVDGHQSMFRTPLAVVAWPTRAAWLFATRDPDGAHLEIMELAPGNNRPRSVWQGPDGCGRGER